MVLHYHFQLIIDNLHKLFVHSYFVPRLLFFSMDRYSR
jgi:hypothetical protein